MPAAAVPDSNAPERLVSMDAFRGAVMLLMASSGLGLPQVAKSFPDSALWRFLGTQTEHAAWVGCTLWDLIQPAFMFMVGVALPWSLANRRARGQQFGRMFLHALWRSVALVALAVFLTSAWSKQTVWVFTNVLAQIGLGYPFLFLLAWTRPRTQWIAAFSILIVYWLCFALYPLPPADMNWQSVDVPKDWPHLTGFAAHWSKNANFASHFDQSFLNLFPSEKSFVSNSGGYTTLNFIPSLATMILGLLAGQWLRSSTSLQSRIKKLALAGVISLAAGALLGLAGVCPIVKRIWTPSWVLFSGGWVMILLAGLMALVEWRGWKRWAFPLVVAGLNPITLYCMWQLMGSSVRENLQRYVPESVFNAASSTYKPIIERTLVLLVYWLILLWMYRRKIFLRI
jgi:heparan-alpha-glucosaminide N-acetyltransferase